MVDLDIGHQAIQHSSLSSDDFGSRNTRSTHTYMRTPLVNLSNSTRMSLMLVQSVLRVLERLLSR